MAAWEQDPLSAKVVLLGDSGVGKTSLAGVFVQGQMPQNPRPTIGAAFVAKRLEYQGNSIELLLWDTAGQELYRSLAPMYYRSAVVAIIVFDVGRADTFSSVDYWINELKKNGDPEMVVVICGNKIDIDVRAVDMNQGQDYATELGVMYTETSAVSGTGVDRLFQSAIGEWLRRRVKPQEGSAVEVNDQSKGKEGGKGCC